MDTTQTTFNSVEDECRYWKERAKQYHKEYSDVKQEYDEYMEQSRQMEAEMDATIDQKQSIIKDLRMKVSALENEIESLQLKFESQSTELNNLEQQFESVKMERDTMKEDKRELEQKNDDLERAHRILNETIANFGRMLDKEYEKNALLEIEVDEKEALQERLQRLMDETRDLKQEMNVKTRHQTTNGVLANDDIALNGELLINSETNNGALIPPASKMTAISSETIDNTNHCRNLHNHNHRSSSNNHLKTANFNEYKQHQTLKNPENILNGNAMSPSSRSTALNIVADMLRKLNAMETKLKTYREQNPPMQPRQ